MQYFPTVGMKKPNETVRANFGQEPFAFDIDKMFQDEKTAIVAEIARTRPASHLATDETELIHQLVAQYLAHDGYVDTGRAFAEEIIGETRALSSDGAADPPYLAAVEDSDAIHRQSESDFPGAHDQFANREQEFEGRFLKETLTKHSSTLPLTTPPCYATMRTYTSNVGVGNSSR